MSQPLLASVDNLKAYLSTRADVQAPADDALLIRLLQAASAIAERRAGRVFHPMPGDAPETTITLTVRAGAGGGRLVIAPDVRDATDVQADGNPVDPADLDWQARRDGEPYVYLRLPYSAERLTVTGRFGFAQPPDDVREAVVESSARALYLRNSRLADVMTDPEGGITQYFRQLLPSAAAVYDSYVVPGV